MAVIRTIIIILGNNRSNGFGKQADHDIGNGRGPNSPVETHNTRVVNRNTRIQEQRVLCSRKNPPTQPVR